MARTLCTYSIIQSTGTFFYSFMLFVFLLPLMLVNKDYHKACRHNTTHFSLSAFFSCVLPTAKWADVDVLPSC